MKRRLLIFSLGLLSLTAITGVFLMSSSVSADDFVVDDVSISVPVSCSLSGTGMSTHNANIANGTYQANIGTTTIKAFCNDTNGFAIYATGYTGNTIGETNSNKLVGVNTNQTITTGTATSAGNPDISNWAMKLETSSGATYALTLDNGFGSYSSVPNTYTKVAHRDSGTDIGTNATGSTLTTTYAAYMSKTQAADTYSGQVIYTLVHPASEELLQPVACEAGKICYQPNSSYVVGEMGLQTKTTPMGSTDITNGASVTLWAPNLKRDGYGFAGWSDKYDYETNEDAHFYGPNQTITAPSDIQTKGLSLYAVWIKAHEDLQGWLGCELMRVGEVTALRDSRDDNAYAVAKLADNKCWMIENLRLDDSAELSSANTHNPSLPITNIYDVTNPTTSNHLSTTTDPTTTAWCTANSSTCDDQSMLATNNTTLFTNNIATSYSISSNVYSYGNYYNWYSATAGNGKYENGSDFVAPGDICPSGWHLPTSGSASTEFFALDVALGGTGGPTYDTTLSSAYRSYPNNFIYSFVVDASINNGVPTGYYWSSSVENNARASILSIGQSSTAKGIFPKYYGLSVRCIAGV